MKKKILSLCLLSMLSFSALAACGQASYRDGTYEGTSEIYSGDESGSGAGYGVVSITISEGKISDCEYRTYELDGTLKDENYGKQNGEVANRDFYNKAQRAVQACEKYAQLLKEKGDIMGVDAISGATVSYQEFVEAVDQALEAAKE